MKYFIDTEFHEYSKNTKFLGFHVGDPTDTIELISIGIVDEKGNEYSAISREFDFDNAWDNEWLRNNVLLPIAHDLAKKEYEEKGNYMHDFGTVKLWVDYIQKGKQWEKIWKKRARQLIDKYGKYREDIAKEIIAFTDRKKMHHNGIGPDVPEFYAYYADYDWVVFCWLFGRMIDLPNHFPMYCKDLKQMLDEAALNLSFIELEELDKNNEKALPLEYMLSISKLTLHLRLDLLKKKSDFPKQENEHDALDDAKWNMKLYNFIKTL